MAPARRFIAEAPAQGVDLDLLWAVGTPPEAAALDAPTSAFAARATAARQARTPIAQFDQVALIVPGAGRVGMVFASPPASRASPASPDPALVQAITAACRGAAEVLGERLALVQALAEEQQVWLRAAVEAASFVSVGRLIYMRRANEPPADPPLPLTGAWPGGVRIITARALGTVDTQNRVLVDLLDRTYQGTLDCPELCGLRATSDILDSHRACGRHDPDLWWIAMRGDQAVGCALFSAYPDQGSIELVYLGLAPEVRGIGLGARLAQLALDRLAHLPVERVACAVDERNAPARRLYDRLGFSRFDTRHAYVRRP